MCDFKKKIRHVPRHIELTAVLREILKQKNKSNRIDRFEKTTRPSVKYKKRLAIISHNIR